MSDPTHLLERATPGNVPDLDYDRLARTGRRRRWMRRTGAGVAVVAIVTAGAFTAADMRRAPSLEVMGGGPGTQPASGPVGAWSQTAELSEGRNNAFAETTADGQLVIYGGTEGVDGPQVRDGHVIDLTDGSTTAISAPPIQDRPFPFVALADHRLVVFGGNDGSADGAYYDLNEQGWTPIPAAPSEDIAPNVRYWDGTTLIVGDSYRMSDRTITNPRLWQWQVGQDTWTALPASPLEAGDLHAAADQGRLAVWTDPVADDTSGIDRPDYADDVTSGQTRLAVYDVAEGSWTAIAREDLPTLTESGRARIGWMDGDLVVVPLPPSASHSERPDDRSAAVEFAAPVAYHADTWEARALDAMPSDLQRDTLEVGSGDGSPVLSPTSSPITATAGRTAAALTTDGTWTDPITASQIRRVGQALVAIDTPWVRDTPLAAAVWDDDGWQPATDPDAPARGFVALTATDEALYLVGGSSLRTAGAGEEPDAMPSEDGASGPYVIDNHDNVVRYIPSDT